MASAHVTASSILSSFLPRLSAAAVSSVTKPTVFYSKQLSHPLLPSLSIAVPSAISLNIPTLLGQLWDGLLNAVPKKKTSYMKKRSRYMAGKALKDVTSLNRCSACGSIKRAHLLCPYCVAGRSCSMVESRISSNLNAEIKTMFSGKVDAKANAKAEAKIAAETTAKPADGVVP